MIKLTDRLITLLVKARKIESLLTQVEKEMDGITVEDLDLVELLPTLTEREMEILNLMVQGKTFAQLPKTLGVSLKTIEAHRWNIRKKLKLKSSKDIERIVLPWMQKKKHK